MSTLTDKVSTQSEVGSAMTTGKFLSDIATVFEIKLLFFVRTWYWYLIGTLVFPLGMFYFAISLAPDTPEAIRRAMTGTIVFGATMMTTNMLAGNLIQDRFQGRLKLIITMPVSKIAYSIGVLLFGAILSASVVVVLLIVAFIAGVSFSFTWAFVPIVVAILITMSGITLFIVSYAPTAEVGSIMANLLGILMVFISPVYFTVDQAPWALRMLGWVSPFRYAADGMMASLSGRTDVWTELAILSAFAVVSMGFGLWKLRWREE